MTENLTPAEQFAELFERSLPDRSIEAFFGDQAENNPETDQQTED